MRIGGDESACTAPRAGTLRWTGAALELCDGTSWGPLGTGDPPSGGGGTGTSCKAILTSGGSVGDGVYTIDPDGPGGQPGFLAYCDMTTDGGGWTVVAHLKAPSHWDWSSTTSSSGSVGDLTGGWSQANTLTGTTLAFNERIIVYHNLIENGSSLGKQFMISSRTDVQTMQSGAFTASSPWPTYRDSFGATAGNVSNVCTHGCTTFRGLGMFSDAGSSVGYHGTQTGDYGCRDGNNICWVSRSMGCNVGSSRCAYLVNPGEGVTYAVR